jgi:hypothetical protein
MERLSEAGWDGPVYAGEGKYRYSKTFSWIRLYIDIEDAGFYGGATGTGKDFEVACINGKWKRFDIEPAQVAGEPVIRLIEYHTLDLVLERLGDGMSIDWNINTIEDMAMYLERSINS